MEYVIEVISGIFAALTQDWASASEPLKHDPKLAYALAGIASLAFISLARPALSILRRAGDWRFSARGTWIETVDHHHGRQYTISNIFFNSKEERFQIIGHTFRDISFDLYSEWQSLSLDFPEMNGLHYHYRLKNYVEGPSDVTGIAHMTFFVADQRSKRFSGGDGYYINLTAEPRRVPYHFRRIDTGLTRRLIQEKRIRKVEDMKRFLQVYSRESANGQAIPPRESSKPGPGE